MNEKNSSVEKLKKQKLTYILLILSILGGIGAVVFLTYRSDKPLIKSQENVFATVSEEIDSENARLANLENLGDVFNERFQGLEKNLLELKEENIVLQKEKNFLIQETEDLQNQIVSIGEIQQQEVITASAFTEDLSTELEPNFTEWEQEIGGEERNVLFEIPAGTVVKAVLISGADCSVAVQKPTGPNMVLLRPIDNGKLPRNVKVNLKGSVIIGNAIGDIASERVYVRGERMTLVEKNGDFIETEITAYTSGEDGREGLRGVVVDRSGQIIRRAGFASFLQGINQSIQATLNNQTIEKLSQVNADKTILDVDMLRDSAFQGVSTSLEKLSDYYIKRAEQLQPTIQIAAGRVVDIIFTKSIRIGESDLKKKLAHERERRERNNA